MDRTHCSYTTASAGPSRPIWARWSFPVNHESAEESDLKTVRPGVTRDVTLGGRELVHEAVLIKRWISIKVSFRLVFWS